MMLLVGACRDQRNFAYDCSAGQADGYGACIPDRHAPKAVEVAATEAFPGEQVDSVACITAREFVFSHKQIRLWRCRRVANGRGITDGRFVCIAAIGGRPVPDSELSRMPRRDLICR
jgi:hypothetical protein